MSVALDEIVSMGSGSIQMRRRLTRLLEGLLTIAPTQHRAAGEQRLAAMTPRDV